MLFCHRIIAPSQRRQCDIAERSWLQSSASRRRDDDASIIHTRSQKCRRMHSQRAGAVAEVAVAAGPGVQRPASARTAHPSPMQVQGRAGQAELDSGAAVMLVGEWFGCCTNSPQTAQVGDDSRCCCPDGCCSRRRDTGALHLPGVHRACARPICGRWHYVTRGGRSESRVFGRSRSHRPSRTRAEIPVLDPHSMELKPVADKGTHRPARNSRSLLQSLASSCHFCPPLRQSANSCHPSCISAICASLGQDFFSIAVAQRTICRNFEPLQRNSAPQPCPRPFKSAAGA